MKRSGGTLLANRCCTGFSISGPTQVFLVAFASSTCRHQAHMGSSEPDALAERYKATVIQSLVSKASSATLTVEEIAA
jgi:hypothetical protein